MRACACFFLFGEEERGQGFLPSSPALVLLALFAAAAVTDLFIVPIYQVASSFFGRGRQTRWLRVS